MFPFEEVDPPNNYIPPRNEKCPCGSGKKFKTCCSEKKRRYYSMGKNYQDVVVIGDVENEHNLQRDFFNQMFNHLTNNGFGAGKISLSKASDILTEAYNFLDESLKPLEQYISCKKGCSACCRIFVEVTPLEAEIIRNHINDNFDQESIHTLSEKAYQNSLIAPKYSELKADISKAQSDYANKRAYCPFNSEDGSCSIYSVRPFNCRKFNVLSHPSLCEDPKNNTDQVDSAIGAKVATLLPLLHGMVYNDAPKVKHISSWFSNGFDKLNLTWE